ncbi:MAG: hypothetical protein AAGF23_24240, partial [Acidobacteriota bacterium]
MRQIGRRCAGIGEGIRQDIGAEANGVPCARRAEQRQHHIEALADAPDGQRVAEAGVLIRVAVNGGRIV